MKSKALSHSSLKRRDAKNASSSLAAADEPRLEESRRFFSRFGYSPPEKETYEQVKRDENVPLRAQQKYKHGVKKSLALRFETSRRTTSSNSENSNLDVRSFDPKNSQSSYNDNGNGPVEEEKNSDTENVLTKKVELTPPPPLRVFDGSNRFPRLRPNIHTPLMSAANRKKNHPQNFTIPPAPFLRENSSSYSKYRHHQDTIPPTLRLTPSTGLRLMSEPLLDTPSEQSCSTLPWLTPVAKTSTDCTTLERMPSASSWMLPFTTPNIVPDAVEGLLSMEKSIPRRNSTSDQPHPIKAEDSFPYIGGGGFKRSLSPQPPFKSISSEYCSSGKLRPINAEDPFPYIGGGGHRRNLSPQPPLKNMPATTFASGKLRPIKPERSFPSIGGDSYYRYLSSQPPFHRNVMTTNPNESFESVNCGPSVCPETRPGIPSNPANNARLHIPKSLKGGKPATDLFNNVPLTDRPCKCSSSRCLKLYCECFRNGFFCDEKLCTCKNCHNNEEHNESRGAREIAIKRILCRRPDAFHVRVQKRAGNGCGCKKSR